MNATINPFNPKSKPYLYTVVFKGGFKQTDNEQTAQKWGLLYDGVIWEDIRYKARLRLYWYLWRKKEYKDK